jgi:ATP-dependent RNA helicase DDX55/SPB4
VKTDRALHDKAQKAFVSWVRAYSKHDASSIFKISDMDWTSLFESWALLKAPRMPELKNWDGDPTLGLEIDFDNYKYQDSAREKRRLEPPSDAAPRPSKKPTPEERKKKAWSGQKMAKEEKEAKREKRLVKREADKRSKMSVEEKTEQDELERMIAEVRRQNMRTADEWEGIG